MQGAIQVLGFTSQIGEILLLCDFFVWLSCPVLFFSATRQGRTAEPIFTLYVSNDVFPRKEVPFGVRTVGDIIWGKYAPKTPAKMGVNRRFQAKTAKYKNRHISETINSIKTKFEDQPTDQQLQFVGGLILTRSNPIWLQAAILKKWIWRHNGVT